MNPHRPTHLFLRHLSKGYLLKPHSSSMLYQSTFKNHFPFCHHQAYSTDGSPPVEAYDPMGIYEYMDEEDHRIAQLSVDEIQKSMPKDVRRNLKATQDKDPKAILQELLIGANELRRNPHKEVDPNLKVTYGIGTQQHVFTIFRMLVTIDEWFTYVDDKLNYVFFTEQESIPKNVSFSQITVISSLGMFCMEQLNSGNTTRGIWIDPGTEQEFYLHPKHFPAVLTWHRSLHMEYAFQCMKVASLIAHDQLEESDYKVRNEKLKELNEVIKSPLAVIKNIQDLLVVTTTTSRGKGIYLNDEELKERSRKYACAFTAIDMATSFCEAMNIGHKNIIQMSMDKFCEQVDKAKLHGITINRQIHVPVWRDRGSSSEINFTLDFVRAIRKLKPDEEAPDMDDEQMDVERIQRMYEDDAKRIEQMKNSRVNQYRKERE